MRVTVFSSQPYDQRFLEETLQGHQGGLDVEFVYQEASLSDQTVSLAQGADAVCVFVNDRLDTAVLEALAGQGARAIFLRCAGFNNVDIAAAKKLGFFVARVPAYSPEAVAEHALALVMTLNRHTNRAWLRVREGNFSLDGLLGTTLSRKTIGIVGAGRIGLATARIFKGIGCRVLGFDVSVSSAFAELGTQVSLDVLLAQSDIVSLHCPLTDANRHMINRATLAQMKRGAMLVNTSRGGLIDTRAVIDSLRSRHLGSLAIDVYEQEESLFFRDRSSNILDDDVFQLLLTFPNVLVTGHQGFFTVEAMREIAEVTLYNIHCFASAVTCPNTIG
ncbi:2-hydroxyacid dehydrogenase [Paraburkholderia sp. Ac-20347]|uniref:2-hydroxyacid dehydrogenase n=1 Tax=Paraburkholderia sp. Ac-20347 TaxID=2703892 RepID=UPI00198201DA|nr:2-hydroxyacid dehydrogenase [Paraburkholderia sp. Ac-20347]MBN3809889.1 2-hydroxyacid dehydrogenase [Paraburkholderia sp. Ac-20347]